ncbi:histidine phosphatase family protein [Antrihabitans cavernicola]|uniref:Histidine phosphatase family protein n=1 Tax=Antrihabitans cavernicola TaxID=2495913 RepID=A0A5A7SBX7_9NOCA|nr:histidine phosphatase family protein [Spelaeibacter cavernicola]KAA0022652.1 histidine phosphatase family protein [Spelaeibacter cavernicola]
MSSVVRLSLVSHAATDALRLVRFPIDESLNEVGRRECRKAARMAAARIVTAPELRTIQTAEALGLLGATTDSALADVDHGSWRGLSMQDLPPDDVATWLSDPTFAGHGGESIVDVIERVRTWLDRVADTETETIAVTHPAVVRAAVIVTLDAPPDAFWRMDIAPLCITRLHHRGAWTLRSTSFGPEPH